jgi:hypothetical protein
MRMTRNFTKENRKCEKPTFEKDDVFRMRMMMIRWMLPRVGDFIRLIDFRRAFLNFFLPASTARAKDPGRNKESRRLYTHNLRYWDQTVFNTAPAAARHSGLYEMPYERN